MSQSSDRMRQLLLVACSALLISSCGGGGKTPSSPGTPAASSTPVQAPTPMPTIAPVSQTCARLPLGDPKAQCEVDTPQFMDEVTDAIGTVQTEHPEYFNGNTVLNPGGYVVGFIKVLDRQGICAYTDNGEEIAVKRDTNRGEQYAIITSKGQTRHFFLYGCVPAHFPTATPAPPAFTPPPGCSLPPSTYITCGRPGDGLYIDDVTAAINKEMQDHPELFDYADTTPVTGWPRVKDPQKYQTDVLAMLTAKGYCGLFDGEEITLKRTNDFSEHYDINQSDNYVRLGPGIYRAACYPAAF